MNRRESDRGKTLGDLLEKWQGSSNRSDKIDMVNSPKHYELLPGIEVYDIRHAILDKHPQLEPSVVDDWSRSWEYLTRMFGKNGLEDAKKAKWYLEKLIERMENE